MEYDLIVAGSGFSGATVAYLAARAGWRVLLYEKRTHIAGNMFDEYDAAGILVQRYGPHTLHTTERTVYDFLTGIGVWEPYTLRARVEIDGKCTPSPFNFRTIDDFYPPEAAEPLKNRLRACFPGRDKVTILELLRCEEASVRAYANFLMEKDYRPYTAKQWGIAPEALDISVLERVPVRLSEVDGYFDDPYEMLPQGGYTAFFAKMLDQPGITLRLGEDALEHVSLSAQGIWHDGALVRTPFVYTGPLDALFANDAGSLGYRSLRFVYETHSTDSYQETAGVAYPLAEGFTRISEYTKLPPQDGHGKTTIAIEYPAPYAADGTTEPYYPILTEENKRLAARYQARAAAIPGLYLCGRLADFQYYNMDQAILRAMQVYDALAKAAQGPGTKGE